MRWSVMRAAPHLTFRNLLVRNVAGVHRSVTTWSPLSVAFNRKPEKKLNFSLTRQNVGLFAIPELVEANGFYLLQDQAVHDAEELVREAISTSRTRKLVAVFDQLSDCLCRVADMADFVRVAHPDPNYASAAEDACIKISALVEKLNTNVEIHRSLRKALTGGDLVPTTPMDDHVAHLFMFDFEQSGIHLEEEKREAFVKLNENILMLGTYFQQGCQKSVTVRRDSLPPHLRDVFTSTGESIMVTGLSSDHHSDQVREAAYRMFLHPNDKQQQLLDLLLEQRNTLAQLVGFSSYGHRALRGTMADNPENVMDFLETLAEKIRPKAEMDFAEMKKLKTKLGNKGSIEPWDPPYYSGLARHEKCEVDSSQLAPYFSLGSCMEGLGMLFSALYGINLRPEHPDYGEMWSHDVHKLAVVDTNEETLGYIYCDLFERPGKPHQILGESTQSTVPYISAVSVPPDCHFTIRGGRELLDGTYQTPIVVLLLNLSAPRGRVPSLLTPGMMENLFHEFGHAMHSMLAKTKYQHVQGTRCPTDFAEVPSVLMEYFASDPRVLSRFARHWQTGEVLPEEQIYNLCLAKKMFAASEMQQQVFYSILDQVYHGSHPLEGSTTDLLERIQNQYYSVPHVPHTAWHLRFGHFVGYGAKYYAYLMSRAVASRIWHHCFKADPFSREMGDQYRHKVLAHGGETPPAILIESLLNEKPTSETLVQSLMDDLDSR